MDKLEFASPPINDIWISGSSVAWRAKLSACLSKVRDIEFCTGSDRNESIDTSRTITKIDFKNPAMLERVKITVIIGSTYKANSWIKISSFNTRILVLTLSTADSY